MLVSAFTMIHLMVFGAKPLPYQLLKGEQLARKQQIWRCEEDARCVLGTWSNGTKKVEVEEIVFLTPGLLSRFLGFRKAEGMSEEEILLAWNKYSAVSANRNMAIIRLTRLCQVNLLEGDSFSNGNPDALDNVEIKVREPGKPWQLLQLNVIQDIQERSQDKVLVDRWEEVVSAVLPWPSEPSKFELIPEIRWGKNRRIGALVEFPNFAPGTRFEMMIKEADRTRNFKLKFPTS